MPRMIDIACYCCGEVNLMWPALIESDDLCAKCILEKKREEQRLLSEELKGLSAEERLDRIEKILDGLARLVCGDDVFRKDSL